MLDQTYPSGPSLAEHFPKIEDKPIPLPIAFDLNCTKCGHELERIDIEYRTRRRPFATFQCSECPHRLYLFEAPRIPLILSHEDFPRSFADSVEFSKFIDELIDKRERNRERDELREIGVLLPT